MKSVYRVKHFTGLFFLSVEADNFELTTIAFSALLLVDSCGVAKIKFFLFRSKIASSYLPFFEFDAVEF